MDVKKTSENALKQPDKNGRFVERGLADRKMSAKAEGKVYRTMIRSVMIYRAEAWTKSRHANAM
jgi:hypothetical protein